MKVPAPIFRAIKRRCAAIEASRPPNFTIGRPGEPYLQRWFLIKHNRFFNIYLHRFLRSDDDRALHDHPWPNASLLLEGSYVEVTDAGREYCCEGRLKFRRATARHRIELERVRPWNPLSGERSVLTLFITGPKIREWGFWCSGVFRHWREYVAPGNSGQIGRGCE